jgi:hypothetical protein
LQSLSAAQDLRTQPPAAAEQVKLTGQSVSAVHVLRMQCPVASHVAPGSHPASDVHFAPQTEWAWSQTSHSWPIPHAASALHSCGTV